MDQNVFAWIISPLIMFSFLGKISPDAGKRAATVTAPFFIAGCLMTITLNSCVKV